MSNRPRLRIARASISTDPVPVSAKSSPAAPIALGWIGGLPALKDAVARAHQAESDALHTAGWLMAYRLDFEVLDWPISHLARHMTTNRGYAPNAEISKPTLTAYRLRKEDPR